MQIYYVLCKRLAPSKCCTGITVVSFFLMPSQPCAHTHNSYVYRHCRGSLIIIPEKTSIFQTFGLHICLSSTCEDKLSTIFPVDKEPTQPHFLHKHSLSPPCWHESLSCPIFPLPKPFVFPVRILCILPCCVV